MKSYRRGKKARKLKREARKLEGELSVPGFSFYSDNTGFYRSGANEIRLAVGGVGVNDFVISGGGAAMFTLSSDGELITQPTRCSICGEVGCDHLNPAPPSFQFQDVSLVDSPLDPHTRIDFVNEPADPTGRVDETLQEEEEE